MSKRKEKREKRSKVTKWLYLLGPTSPMDVDEFCRVNYPTFFIKINKPLSDKRSNKD